MSCGRQNSGPSNISMSSSPESVNMSRYMGEGNYKTKWAFAASAVGKASAASVISEIINDYAYLISLEVSGAGKEEGGVTVSAPRGTWRVSFINWASETLLRHPLLPCWVASRLQTVLVEHPPEETTLNMSSSYSGPHISTYKHLCTVPTSHIHGEKKKTSKTVLV